MNYLHLQVGDIGLKPLKGRGTSLNPAINDRAIDYPTFLVSEYLTGRIAKKREPISEG